MKTLHIRSRGGSRCFADPAVLFAVGALVLGALPLALAKATPLNDQPFPDSQEYADAVVGNTLALLANLATVDQVIEAWAAARSTSAVAG